MEAPRRRSMAEGDEDNLSPQQSGQLNLGPYPARHAKDLPRGGGATDHVCMLSLVKLKLENADHAISKQDTGTAAESAGRAARAISGAYKATSAPALDIETHLLPIEHQIWKHNADCLGVGNPRIPLPFRIQTSSLKVLDLEFKLFSSGHLPLLAFDEGMLKDLAGMDQNRQRAFVPQPNRSHLLHVWDANKRHLRAISSLRRHPNFGVRKEVTLRLDVILAMWADGALEPSRSPHTGPMAWDVPLDGGDDARASGMHCRFWAIPTEVMTSFVSTQAARLIHPLDHIFQEVTRKEGEQPSSSTDPVRQILAFYTAQLFCRLLIYALDDEEEQNLDNWIWRSVWTVRTRGRGEGSVKERRGLGLGAHINASGLLWIPHGHIDWQRGLISLEVLVNLYMSRSPLQTRLAHQPNVQALTITQVTVELLFQQVVRDAREAYDQGHNEKAEKLAGRAIVLAVEETARAYHQHFLAKIESYWDRVESAAEAGRIPTAQTIHGIYAEAWAKYGEAVPADNNIDPSARDTLPDELPCWMTTRRRLPPKNSWSDFLFNQLFGRSKPPAWGRLYFLQVYRVFKDIWRSICAPAGPFDSRFSVQIGRYIQIAFNSDHSKEVGTSHGPGTWHRDKPSFFQIQYWAPYFSPLRGKEDTFLSSVYRRGDNPEGLSPDMTPMIPSLRDLQGLERAAWPHWVKIMEDIERLRSAGHDTIRRHCRRALLYVTYLVGPTWGRDGDVNFVQPWSLKKPDVCEYEEEDVFWVPVKKTYISRWIFESAVSQLTILLLTRDNLVGLLDAIGSLPGHSPAFAARLRWTRCRLNNHDSQYDLRSHLEAKKQEVEPSTQSQTLLNRFLNQAEPPQWDVNPADVSGVASEEEDRVAIRAAL
ncbi:hypothetical protein MRS44_003956 [Fusarium solani]|uniref:uncharacterized protein n=1 Tax=Fusarium solani TaxID=169388 RepID=UPI0032C436D2|nr:hypothetical protein MRS44_003956 [Fusarium solani]